VHVVVIDEDNQEGRHRRPRTGEMFGLASMLSARPTDHRVALEPTTAIEISGTTWPPWCSASRWPAWTSSRVAAASSTPPRSLSVCAPPATPTSDRRAADLRDSVADSVARFGGSWKFIITFGVVLVAWVAVNVGWRCGVDPYPFILLNLFLSMLARDPGAGHHDEPEPPGREGRVRSEQDFAVNRKPRPIIQVAAKLHRIETVSATRGSGERPHNR